MQKQCLYLYSFKSLRKEEKIIFFSILLGSWLRQPSPPLLHSIMKDRLTEEKETEV